MDKKSFFPLFIDLNEKKCLVVGGGKIAYRKIKTLLEYGAKVEVVAPKILDEIYKLDVDIRKESYKKEFILDKTLVVAGTDNEDINLQIVKDCDNKRILVNNITSKTEMSARFSAIIEAEEYQLGISAKGDPKKALKLKEKILEIL